MNAGHPFEHGAAIGDTAYVHTMTDADRVTLKELTAAQEETNKQNSWAGERIPRKG